MSLTHLQLIADCLKHGIVFDQADVENFPPGIYPVAPAGYVHKFPKLDVPRGRSQAAAAVPSTRLQRPETQTAAQYYQPQPQPPSTNLLVPPLSSRGSTRVSSHLPELDRVVAMEALHIPNWPTDSSRIPGKFIWVIGHAMDLPAIEGIYALKAVRASHTLERRD